MSLYLVTGKRPYRNHKPGEAFEAVLAADAEARAVARGDIELLERSTPSIRPGSWQLPRGWNRASRQQEA